MRKRGCFWCEYRKGLKCDKDEAIDFKTVLRMCNLPSREDSLSRKTKNNVYIGCQCNSFKPIIEEELQRRSKEKIVFT